MAITKFLARDITTEIKISSVFTAIGGLTTIAHSPSKTAADATDMDSNGRAEHVVVQRGDQWTLTGHVLEDVSSGARDPGQEAVEDLSQEIGLSAHGTFRMTSPGGNVIEFEASADVQRPAGGHNDLATWQATIEVTGDVSYTGPGS